MRSFQAPIKRSCNLCKGLECVPKHVAEEMSMSRSSYVLEVLKGIIKLLVTKLCYLVANQAIH